MVGLVCESAIRFASILVQAESEGSTESANINATTVTAEVIDTNFTNLEMATLAKKMSDVHCYVPWVC